MHARCGLALAALAVTALLLADAFAAGFLGTTVKVRWQTDLHAAHRQAVEQDKPLLVVFGAKWCGYCKKLEQKTLGRRQLAEYVNTKFVPVHLDFDKDPQVAEVLEVKSLPCTVVLSPEADLIGRLDGYVEHDKYTELLDGALEMQTRIHAAERSSAALGR